MLIISVLLLIIAAAYIISPKPATPVSYMKSNAGKFLQPDGWKGTPVDAKGRFINEEYPFYQNFLSILIWLPGHLINLIKNRYKKFTVNAHDSFEALQKSNQMIWLGHASFYLHMNGINFLIDPHFYNTFIYRRHTKNPFDPNLFRNIHYILLSHDHADHCDKRSLQMLIKNNPGVTILCGLNMDKLVKSFIKQDVKMITFAWYDEFTVSASIKIYFVPSRHYSKRIFKKFNSTLWGGFIISSKNADDKFQTIYYSGDSGYGKHFKTIGSLFKPTVAVLPIGAYKPYWFMHPNHMSPDETLQAFKDSGAGLMIPMHCNTFNLSNENMEEPLRKIEELINIQSIADINPGIVYKL